MIRSSVDLPPPLGPSSAVSEPRGTSTVDVVERGKVPKRLEMSRTSMPISVISFGTQELDDAAGQHTANAASTVATAIRRRLVEVLEALLDEERAGSGSGRRAARRRPDRAELTERAGQAEHDAVGEGPADRREGDPPERLPAVRAQRAGRLLLVVAELLEHRARLADHQGQGHEDGGQHHAGQAKMICDPVAVEPAADQPLNGP